MRVGLYGGSFNPAHEGHAHVAETAKRRLRLDRMPERQRARLTLLQGAAVHDVTVHSIDHQQFLRHQAGI